MSISFVSLKCPECGASLDIEEGRKQLFCAYCGHKIIIQNDNEHIIRHIDDAEVLHAETEQAVKLKQLELEEKLIEDNRKARIVRIKISIVLGAVGLAFSLIGLLADIEGIAITGMIALTILMWMWFIVFAKREEMDHVKIPVPDIVNGYSTRTYEEVRDAFQNAGFTNVVCMPRRDLTFGLINKPTYVSSIQINGGKIKTSGRKFSSDAPVIITYYSR